MLNFGLKLFYSWWIWIKIVKKIFWIIEPYDEIKRNFKILILAFVEGANVYKLIRTKSCEISLYINKPFFRALESIIKNFEIFAEGLLKLEIMNQQIIYRIHNTMIYIYFYYLFYQRYSSQVQIRNIQLHDKNTVFNKITYI